MWFFVIFCPPIYFFVRKKFGAGIFSSILCLLALIMIFIPPIALFIGFIAIAHAAVSYGKYERSKFAQEQAREIAKAIKQQQ